MAQPADLPIPTAKGDPAPPGVRTGRIDGQLVYLDSSGRVLYGMDMRVQLRAGPDPAQFCTGDCAKDWEPVLAPAGTAPDIAFPRGTREPLQPKAGKPIFYNQPQDAPDWTVISGPQGPQWVYKGWHMVFVRRTGDARSAHFDGLDGRVWNTLKFVPPAPHIVAPPAVQTTALSQSYVLTDGAGRLLYVGKCASRCTAWQPFQAGMAAAAIGDWRVLTAGDVPQWSVSGQPVFVAESGEIADVPAGGKVLRP